MVIAVIVESMRKEIDRDCIGDELFDVDDIRSDLHSTDYESPLARLWNQEREETDQGIEKEDIDLQCKAYVGWKLLHAVSRQ